MLYTVEDRLKMDITAAVVARSYSNDNRGTYAFLELLRENYDLNSRDIDVTIVVEGHIGKEMYERLAHLRRKNTEPNPAEKALIEAERAKLFTISLPSWHNMASVNATIEVADNELLDNQNGDEMPSYEEYLKMTKTVKVQDICKSGAFTAGLEDGIRSAAIEKSKGWLKEKIVIYKADLEEAGKEVTEEDVLDAIRRDYKAAYFHYTD